MEYNVPKLKLKRRKPINIKVGSESDLYGDIEEMNESGESLKLAPTDSKEDFYESSEIGRTKKLRLKRKSEKSSRNVEMNRKMRLRRR